MKASIWPRTCRGEVKLTPAKALLARIEKPDLDLVEPGGMGRDEMKMDVRVAREPAILLGPPQLGVIGRIGHQPAGLRKHSGQRMQPEGDESELRARHEINARFER